MSASELRDPCLGCEAAEITQGNYCATCAELAAESAAERLHEGEPPMSVREHYLAAWVERATQDARAAAYPATNPRVRGTSKP